MEFEGIHVSGRSIGEYEAGERKKEKASAEDLLSFPKHSEQKPELTENRIYTISTPGILSSA